MVPHELTGNLKKKSRFVVSSLILCNNNEPFSFRLWCMMKVDQWWPAQWLNQEEAPKHFPKLNLHQKRSWPLFGGMWLVWILMKPVHLRRMLSKSVTYTENCNACSQHWSTEWAQFFSMTIINHVSHNQRSKSWTNWATKVCRIHHLHLTSHQWQPTSTSSNF